MKTNVTNLVTGSWVQSSFSLDASANTYGFGGRLLAAGLPIRLVHLVRPRSFVAIVQGAEDTIAGFCRPQLLLLPALSPPRSRSTTSAPIAR
jgi:hypothetical protein